MILPGSSCQVLVLSVGNVLASSVVSVFLGQSKVYQEQLVAVSSNSHEEVVWLDVAMDEVLVVNILNSANHLVGQHQDSLHGEPPGAEVEEILEAGSEQVHDQDVVVSLLSVPSDVGDAHSALQNLVQFALVQQLRVTGLHTLQLDSNLRKNY